MYVIHVIFELSNSPRDCLGVLTSLTSRARLRRIPMETLIHIIPIPFKADMTLRIGRSKGNLRRQRDILLRRTPCKPLMLAII